MDEIHTPEITAYVNGLLPPVHPLFGEIEHFTLHEMPNAQMLSGRYQAHLLAELARLAGARSALEIGCFTGYTSLYLAERSGVDRVVTLELDPRHAKIAQGYFDRLPAGRKVRLMLGDALQSLASLAGQTFDFVYIDADKERYPDYFEAVRGLLGPCGLVVADNVLRHGKVAGSDDQSEATRAIRRYNELVTHLDGFESFILPLRDGLMVTRRSA